MLSTSHHRAYQDFMTLLTEFNNFLGNLASFGQQAEIKKEFKKIQRWFNDNIAGLEAEIIGSEFVESEIFSRWLSVQTEIKREFKLLTTDILFLATTRQKATEIERRKNISDRTTKLIGYCQIILKA